MTGSTLKERLPETIRTARLTLKAPARADLDELVVLANNSRVAENLARLPHPYGLEDGLFFIEDFAQRPTQRPYAIHTEGHFIGVTGLTLEDGKPPELGYWIGEPFWGKGYATEAARGLLDALRQTGTRQLFARALAGNTGSRAVLRKLGFTKTREYVGDCGPHKDRRIVEMRLELGQ
jgi:RimJ/RimL family protein N-acetyltransferase